MQLKIDKKQPKVGRMQPVEIIQLYCEKERII